ncbi:MAG: hypothetical protein MSD82_12375 [Prevotella sp.]|nr:hypothetical protein [Prevotella sp.]
MIRYRKDDEIYNGHYIKVDGAIIINPTEEMLTRYGYVKEEYEVPATPQTEPMSGEVIELLKELAQSTVTSLPDKDAVSKAALFPTWASRLGKDVKTGERLWYDGNLYKVIQDHTAQEAWKPGEAVSLYRVIPADQDAGTLDNPVTWVLGMAAELGKHYTDGANVYKCIRDSGGVGLHYDLPTLTSIQYMQKL